MEYVLSCSATEAQSEGGRILKAVTFVICSCWASFDEKQWKYFLCWGKSTKVDTHYITVCFPRSQKKKTASCFRMQKMWIEFLFFWTQPWIISHPLLFLSEHNNDHTRQKDPRQTRTDSEGNAYISCKTICACLLLHIPSCQLLLCRFCSCAYSQFIIYSKMPE